MLTLDHSVPSSQPPVQQLKSGIEFVTGSVSAGDAAPPFQLLRHGQVLTHASIYSSHSDKLEEKDVSGAENTGGEDLTREKGSEGNRIGMASVSHRHSPSLFCGCFRPIPQEAQDQEASVLWGRRRLFQKLSQELWLSPTAARAVGPGHSTRPLFA